MGILKLADLIRFDAPASVKSKEIGDYSGKISVLHYNKATKHLKLRKVKSKCNLSLTVKKQQKENRTIKKILLQ